MENLNQIIKQFPEVGEVKEVKALTSGLINQTYLVKTVDPQEADYVSFRLPMERPFIMMAKAIGAYQYSFPVHRLWKLSLPTLLIWQV